MSGWLGLALALGLLSGCVHMMPAPDRPGAQLPCLSVADGVSATVKKPRGAGVVVGIALTLDG